MTERLSPPQVNLGMPDVSNYTITFSQKFMVCKLYGTHSEPRDRTRPYTSELIFIPKCLIQVDVVVMGLPKMMQACY